MRWVRRKIDIYQWHRRFAWGITERKLDNFTTEKFWLVWLWFRREQDPKYGGLKWSVKTQAEMVAESLCPEKVK